jgi:hypothetical protein
MTAQVEILVTQLENVLSVPVQAVLTYDNKDHIAVKKPDGVVELREVALGLANDESVEVKQGLKNGEVVMLNPRDLLNSNSGQVALPATRKDSGAQKDLMKARAKGKGGRGANLPPALRAKLQAMMKDMAPEDRTKLFTGSPEEREAILKKAGLNDAELQQLEQARKQAGGPG